MYFDGFLRYDRKKKVPVVCLVKKKRYSHLSVGCAVPAITTGKKKDTVICLTGCAVVLFFIVAGNFDYDRKKKRYSRLSGGCAIIITTGKKKDTIVNIQFVLVQLELKLIQIC